jgi:predicted transcriptional regulator
MCQASNIIKDVSTMISSKQIKAARLFLDWEQKDLAAAADLSLPTIQRMEKLGLERSSLGNAQRVKRALEAAGVVFIPENGGGPGVRLRKGGQ